MKKPRSDRNSINPNTGQPEFADDVLAPPQGPMETVEVTGRRPFSPNDINVAIKLMNKGSSNRRIDFPLGKISGNMAHAVQCYIN
jgi:hypothetical protein